MHKALALAALAIPLVVAGCSQREMYYSAPPPPAYSDFAQRGFHDGFEAARHDMARGFAPDADRHDRFRRPPVPRRAIDDYRHGFREGYRQAFHGDRRDWH